MSSADDHPSPAPEPDDDPRVMEALREYQAALDAGRRPSRREQAVLLADALNHLPADYREVLILRHLEGLTFPEVADRMGRSLDSVEKLWVRALPRLRRALGAEP